MRKQRIRLLCVLVDVPAVAVRLPRSGGPFPYCVAVGAVCQMGAVLPPFWGLDMAVLPPASLRSPGYPQGAAGKNKGKRKVKGGSMPAKPLSMRGSRGGGERNITKAERNITKAERNITKARRNYDKKARTRRAGWNATRWGYA